MLRKLRSWNRNRRIQKLEKWSVFFEPTNEIHIDYGTDISIFGTDSKHWNYCFGGNIDWKKKLSHACISFTDNDFLVIGLNEEEEIEVLTFPRSDIHANSLSLMPAIDINDELKMCFNYFRSSLEVNFYKNQTAILHFNPRKLKKEKKKQTSILFKRTGGDQ